ncbi:MAG: NADPH-dependent glutamate synthase [Acidimicrobiia bacterium]|nr:NADPH-dependent glutamate synthase [Acidimicrobiia bacterium]
MTELTRRQRMAKAPTAMPERPPQERRFDFEEVNLGYTAELAVAEAERCLFCAHPPCVDGCPVGVDIFGFLEAVAAGDFLDAADAIAKDNSLPAICGRVCPQEVQCEGACVLAKKDKAIHIGHLERFVADYARTHRGPGAPAPAPASGRHVAVVGSGPAGLACATDLAKAGHRVTVFEALHVLGGVLTYGIPEFRLPKEIVNAEIAQLAELGVRFETNAVIGMVDTVDELLTTFDAVFIGVGAGLPRFLGVPGEDLIGVYSANEFLTRVNLMKAYTATADTPLLDLYRKRVVVFGGGNTAMDAVRTALRLGAASASILYRRTEAEMPARDEEVEHAKAEGVEIVTLVSPLQLLAGVNSGLLAGVRLQRMELGEPDDSGRRRPQPINGATFDMDIDVAVIAIGNSPNPLLLRTTPGLTQTDRGTLVIDNVTCRTSRPAVFAGGDIVTGGATVIVAMGHGRRAAAAIDDWLMNRQPATIRS